MKPKTGGPSGKGAKHKGKVIENGQVSVKDNEEAWVAYLNNGDEDTDLPVLVLIESNLEDEKDDDLPLFWD